MLKIAPIPFFILGPTAIGKSAVAVEVAAHLSGEIINADAFQIYRGINLLSAKPDADLLSRVPHHLISEIPLSEECDAARFAELARRQIAEVQGRGRLPIIVGGTGFYVRALTHGLPELPGADVELRLKLEETPLPDLVARLDTLDPLCATEIDRSNPRRVIRALEVCLLTGRPFSSFREASAVPAFPLRGVVLTCPREVQLARIKARTKAMWSDGVVDEVRAVLAEIPPISRTAEQAIGFREIRRHLAGELTAAECIAAIQTATRQYAKRQMTWFRRETAFAQIDREDAFQAITRMITENAPNS